MFGMTGTAPEARDEESGGMALLLVVSKQVSRCILTTMFIHYKNGRFPLCPPRWWYVYKEDSGGEKRGRIGSKELAKNQATF